MCSTWTKPAVGISTYTTTKARTHVFADQPPQAMTDKYDRFFILCVSVHCIIYKAGRLTVSSLFRNDERELRRSHPCLDITCCNSFPCTSLTYALYPKASVRAVGNMDGRRVLGHGSVEFWPVHVASQSSVIPWTKTILEGKVRSAFLYWRVRTRPCYEPGCKTLWCRKGRLFVTRTPS